MIDPLVAPDSRREALTALYERLRYGESCAIVGLNDSGKTTLLTLAQHPDVVRRFAPPELQQRCLFVTVDCNLLAGGGERDVYALMGQRTVAAARRAGYAAAADKAAALLQPGASGGQLPLLDAMALEAMLTQLVEDERLLLVFLLDEFDALYAHVERRAVLALRAFDNRLGPSLAFAVTLERPLRRTRTAPPGETGEFEEIFTGGALALTSLSAPETEAFVRRYVTRRGGPTGDWLPAYLAEQTGGHAGLLWAACGAAHRLGDVGRDTLDAALSTAPDVVAECENVWLRLNAAEHETVLALRRQHPLSAPQAALAAELRERGLLSASAGGTIAIPVLERYVASLVAAPDTALVFDARSGVITVNGRAPASPLGPTEFRLLQVLAERPAAIVTKDDIARAVWPQEQHVGGIDDARIDKLVDRVRAKIEPDPRTPRFIITVRGLGYRLLPGGA